MQVHQTTGLPKPIHFLGTRIVPPVMAGFCREIKKNFAEKGGILHGVTEVDRTLVPGNWVPVGS
jgi:hypothetical protein